MQQRTAAPARTSIVFRAFQPGDAPSVVECLRDEYQDSYFRKAYYDPAFYLSEEAASRLRIFIAELNDVIIGFLVGRRSENFRGQVELGTMIIRRSYRGLRLSAPFIQYVMDQLSKDDCTALMGYPQMFHTISQNNLYGLGLTPTGVFLSQILTAPLKHSYRDSAGQKLALGVMVAPRAKTDAGRVYLPAEHAVFARKMYSEMGVSFQIRYSADPTRDAATTPAGDDAIRCDIDDGQHTDKLIIDAYSEAARALVAARIDMGREDPLRTINLMLNCSHPSAIAAYAQLAEMGFVFTGMQPLCEGAEYLLMHHPLRVPVVFEDAVLADIFKPVVRYVQNGYEVRR